MRFRIRGVYIAAVLLFGLLAVGTMRSLRPWFDEAQHGTPAWTLVDKGYMGTPSLDVGATGMQRIDRYSYWIMPLYPLVQAAWYTVVPFNLSSLRALSVVFVLVGIACFSYFVRRLTQDRVTAALCFALLSCDYFAITAAGTGRPDGLAFMFNAASFAAYLHLREQHLLWALLAGNACAVASGLTHPNGGMLSVLGLAFLVLSFDRRRLTLSHLGIVIVPYLVGTLGWGAYILEDPAAFISQYAFQTAGRFGGLIDPFTAVWAETYTRYVNNMGLGRHSEGSVGPHFLKALVFCAYFVGIGGILATRELRRTTAAHVLLGIMAMYLCFYTFLEGTKAAYYLIYIICVYSALLVVWVRWLWRRRVLPHWAIALAIAGIMVVQTGGSVQRMRIDKYQGYARSVEFLKAHVKPDDLVVGSLEWGFGIGFTDHFLDDTYLGTRSGRVPDYVLMEEIYRENLRTMRAKSPEDYERVRRRLAEYRVVYSRDFYDILARQSAATPSP